MIENCSIRDTGFAGIEILRNFRAADGEGPGHQRVAVRDVSVDSGKYGVYIGTRSRSVTLERVRVTSALEVGVYIDADSTEVSLTEVVVSGTQRREGIAVDSATEITIEESTTRNNRGGGIRLYHNCGELRGSVCPVTRGRGASNNVIRRNRIEDGLIVASRQGERYQAGLCSDLSGEGGAMRDIARGNRIVENVFVSPASWASLSLHDGPNAVIGNRFVAVDQRQCLAMQLSPRAYGGELLSQVSLVGTTIAGNDFGSCDSQLRDVDVGQVEFGVNNADGGVCRGLPATASCLPPDPLSGRQPTLLERL